MSKDRIDFMLIELRDLEKMISEVRDAELIPDAFFDAAEGKVVKFLEQLYFLKEEEKNKPQVEKKAAEIVSTIYTKRIIPEIKEEVSILNEKHISNSLNEIIEKQLLTDIRKGFSLNDRFRFLRELFAGDAEKMDKILNELNELDSLSSSITYLYTMLNWNIEDPTVSEFINILEKRFR